MQILSHIRGGRQSYLTLHTIPSKFFNSEVIVRGGKNVKRLLCRTEPKYSAGIRKESMWARNQVGLSYRPGRQTPWLADLIPWNRFLGSLKFKNSGSEFLLFERRRVTTSFKPVHRPFCSSTILLYYVKSWDMERCIREVMTLE